MVFQIVLSASLDFSCMPTEGAEQLEKPSVSKFPEGHAIGLWQTQIPSQILGLPCRRLRPAVFLWLGCFRGSESSHFFEPQPCAASFI